MTIILGACLGISGMNVNEGYWGGYISIISQNFPKSPSVGDSPRGPLKQQGNPHLNHGIKIR
jgi:hypothetical protein